MILGKRSYFTRCKFIVEYGIFLTCSLKHSFVNPSNVNFMTGEIYEAQTVFARQIYYHSVRIHECSKFSIFMHRIVSMYRKEISNHPPSAISIGNHIYFPVNLPNKPISVNHPEHYKIGWLIHELTHVWQFQHIGWKYLTQAIQLQIQMGKKAYNFGGEKGLKTMLKEQKHINDFNLEQQGDITRTYYERKTQAKSVQSWEPFIEDIRTSRRS